MEPDKQDDQSATEPAVKAYDKRPIWQWILIYVIVGGLVYWLIYYFVTAGGTSNDFY